MANSRNYKADTIRSIAFGSITDSYMTLGSVLGNPSQIIIIKNTTDKTIFLSENGTDNHYELGTGTSDSYDFQSNSKTDDIAAKAKGTQFYVKGVTGDLPASGKVIIQIQYL